MTKIKPPITNYLVVFSLLLCGVSISSRGDEPPRSNEPIEEVVIQGKRFEIDSTVAFERLTEANDKRARLYKQGKYREALPYFLVGASTGFKMSQARAGTIYLRGLGGVGKDITKGLGWLGVGE